MSWTVRNVLNKINSEVQEYLFRRELLDESKFHKVEFGYDSITGEGEIFIHCDSNRVNCNGFNPFEMTDDLISHMILNRVYAGENDSVTMKYGAGTDRIFVLNDPIEHTFEDCYITVSGCHDVYRLKISKNLMIAMRR